MNEPDQDQVQQSTANHVGDPAEEKRVQPAEALEELREPEQAVSDTTAGVPAEETEATASDAPTPTETDSNPSS